DRIGRGAADPGVIVIVGEDTRLARLGIQRQDPAILVIRGPGQKHSLLPVLGPYRLQELDVSVLRGRRPRRRFGGAAPAVLGPLRRISGRRRRLLSVIDILYLAGRDVDQREA